MSSNSTQNSVEGRNRIFAIGGLVVVLFLLTVLIEKNLVRIKQQEPVEPSEPEKHEVLTKTPVTPKTTVTIQPLITRFPPLPDCNSIKTVDERKAVFIDYLTPIINYQNGKVLKDRTHLEQILKLIVNSIPLPVDDREWLQQLAKEYDVEWEEQDPGKIAIKLARRVDIIPVSLALVQAAVESSWGRSRYAVKANNLFGQWCFEEGCGVIPGDRAPDASHEVKRFKTVNAAVRSYIHNLNTHPKYKTLRQIRQNLRIHRKKITGEALADGLLYYSERREDYVDEVKTMIEQYQDFQERRAG